MQCEDNCIRNERRFSYRTYISSIIEHASECGVTKINSLPTT